MPTYTLKDRPDKDTIQLQSIGHVVGEPARNIKAGDTLMWNFGHTENVLSIVRETNSFVIILTEYRSGLGVLNKGERKLKKDRLVCILKNKPQ